MSKILDAVSVVLTCGDEIFVIQRQFFLSAFPGYWAFPGGKVEKDDASLIPAGLMEDLDPKLFGAAVREIKEELGIDLRDEILKGRVLSAHYLGLAVTPDFNPHRFSTYFFKVQLKEKMNFIVDPNEARTARWMKSEELLRLYDSGEILAVPPIIKVIQTLGHEPHKNFIEDLNFFYDHIKYVPFIESIKGVRQLMPLSNTLPPASRTNSFLIGDDLRILIDPSPKDDEEFEKFKNTLYHFGVHKILLTHHHPDHHEKSNKLALELGVPVLLSEYTRVRITRTNPGYFDGIELQLLKEGDLVTQWLGQDVLIMEIPGHDEGQLGLYPKDLSWFLAGDLFQGIGTVVIGGEEGNMKKYFQTLERIIALSPRVVFPSHGIGLGGTFILEKTLKHRRERESQILKLHQEGIRPEDMLKIIYADVDSKLWPYALENIQKHLIKLKEEDML